MAEIWSGLVVLFIFLAVIALTGFAVFVIWNSLKRSVGIKGKLSIAMQEAKAREKEISARVDQSLMLSKESLQLQKEMLEAQHEMNRLLAELLRARRPSEDEA